jgi:hypothetical protein
MDATCTESFADQRPAVMALAALLSLAPDLPAADIQLGWVAGAAYAQGLTVALHGGPGQFEPWRTVLGIAPAAVTLVRFGDGEGYVTAYLPAALDESPRGTPDPALTDAR